MWTKPTAVTCTQSCTSPGTWYQHQIVTNSELRSDRFARFDLSQFPCYTYCIINFATLLKTAWAAGWAVMHQCCAGDQLWSFEWNDPPVNESKLCLTWLWYSGTTVNGRREMHDMSKGRTREADAIKFACASQVGRNRGACEWLIPWPCNLTPQLCLSCVTAETQQQQPCLTHCAARWVYATIPQHSRKATCFLQSWQPSSNNFLQMHL